MNAKHRPFFLMRAYREFDREKEVWAPAGIHLLVRAWRYRWRSVIPLYLCRLWFVETGGLLKSGHLCWPWSECWVLEERKRRDEMFKAGIIEGRRQERERSDLFFEQYISELRKGRDEGRGAV